MHEKLRPYVWTIDRDLNVFLMCVQTSHRDLPDQFVFSWKRELGAAKASSQAVWLGPRSDDRPYEYDVTWNIECLYLPKAFGGDGEEIKGALTEAFEAYGEINRPGAPPCFTKVNWDNCVISVGGSGNVVL